ncbi:hypothetical protein [Natrialbaceae archaeon AArc-T1-2]|uniref:hypothetical protein n=1 Tax=Natrialbaceae archaeon AArc-T1-2 TaxID=3053904 RepID=UPI00255A7CDC|nr:hypothetical protein [Natrialbaceae archaeon AArc-T1-2]WIV68823.1 hypothetical protein QQ977_16085 [Natrialbaceae archaeon AArc-T1-2]
MSNEDSRGHKNPDRPREATTDDQTTDHHTSDHHIPDPNALTDEARLEAIDRLAAALLESASRSDDERREFTRHCREIRAEVECARRALSDDDGMVRARGVASTSWLGPKPGVVASRDGCTDDRDGCTDELGADGGADDGN